MTDAERKNNIITVIDVLFGSDQPWYGFEKLERPVAPKNEGKKWENVWLTVRKGIKREIARLPSALSLLTRVLS